MSKIILKQVSMSKTIVSAIDKTIVSTTAKNKSKNIVNITVNK